MKRNNIIKSIVVIVVIAILVMGVAVYLKVGELKEGMAHVQIGNMDLARIDDGVYSGEYNFEDTISVKVEVAVSDNRITNIDILEHNCGLGGKAEIITERVVDSQDLSVDVISGATASSKAILKAIEDALK
jgi:uncharacterized protein with FMN-binding domain